MLWLETYRAMAKVYAYQLGCWVDNTAVAVAPLAAPFFTRSGIYRASNPGWDRASRPAGIVHLQRIMLCHCYYRSLLFVIYWLF
jgi:hypothetical protein